MRVFDDDELVLMSVLDGNELVLLSLREDANHGGIWHELVDANGVGRDGRVSDAEGDVIGERPLVMQHARDGGELVLMEVLDDYQLVLMSVREEASDLRVRSELVDASYVECSRSVSHGEDDVAG